MSESEPAIAASAIDEDEVALLATGFALGELDEPDLQRLYDLLRTPGDTGHQAARIAWRTLGTTVDLRASLSDSFQDEVRQKLVDAAEPERTRGVLGGVFARIGRKRPQLSPIASPDGSGQGTPVPPLLRWLGPIAVALLIVLVAWSWPRASGLVTVEQITGSIELAGRTIRPGGTIGSEAVVVPAGTAITLRWQAGHQASLTGPATLFIAGPASASLTHGLVRWQTTGTFTLGLPDRQLRLDEATVISEAGGSASQIAVVSGSVHSPGPPALSLTPGQVLADTNVPFSATTRSLPDAATVNELGEASTRTWQLQGTITVGGRRSALRISDAASIDIRITPTAVELRQLDQAVQQLAALPGPPRRDRQLVCQSGVEGTTSIVIDGDRIIIPRLHPPLVVEPIDGCRLRDGRFSTGPRFKTQEATPTK